MTAEVAKTEHPSHDHDDHARCAHDAAAEAPVANAGLTTFRISTMDCAVEEGEIRNALEKLDGIKALRFQLGARTLGIDALPPWG